jgi:hypothetical protein
LRHTRLATGDAFLRSHTNLGYGVDHRARSGKTDIERREPT